MNRGLASGALSARRRCLVASDLRQDRLGGSRHHSRQPLLKGRRTTRRGQTEFRLDLYEGGAGESAGHRECPLRRRALRSYRNSRDTQQSIGIGIRLTVRPRGQNWRPPREPHLLSDHPRCILDRWFRRHCGRNEDAELRMARGGTLRRTSSFSQLVDEYEHPPRVWNSVVSSGHCCTTSSRSDRFRLYSSQKVRATTVAARGSPKRPE